MSVAENVVAIGTVPDNWAAEAGKLQTIVDGAFTELDSVRASGNTQVQAIRFERNEEGNPILDEDNNPVLYALTDDQGNPVLDDHPLIHREKHHGLHAYRYEPCSDGSVVAFYVNERNGAIKMKAFASIEEASQWSPRDERSNNAG